MMRGADNALVDAVKAELRAVQAIPVPQAHGSAALDADAVKLEAMAGAGAAGATLADVGLPPVPTFGAYTEANNAEGSAPLPTAPVAVVPAPPAPTATVAEMRDKLNAACKTEIPVEQFAAGSPNLLVPPAPLTFADLMKHVTPMLVSGKLPQDTLLAVTAEFGLPHLAALGARPDLVEAVRARIDEVVG
jgi:hypothetical protein